MASSESTLVQSARERLSQIWNLTKTTNFGTVKPELPSEVVEAVERIIGSKTKTYRYVLPTQLLAKVVEPALDSRAIPKASQLRGSFDARSLCHKVIVPFDRENHCVLGGSAEPYVSKPLRMNQITPEYAGNQKDRRGYGDLCLVLQFAEDHPALVESLLRATLACISRRLDLVQIAYPAPSRISLDQTKTMIRSFLQEPRGGVRLQAVALALFECLGETLQLFHQVRSAPVNAADAATGQAADLQCLDAGGGLVLAVEVKHRAVTWRHVEDKVPSARQQRVRELLFLTQGGVAPGESNELEQLIIREFVTGQNIYVVAFESFLEACLVLLRERGRTQFLITVGRSLDRLGADLPHREAWRQLLLALYFKGVALTIETEAKFRVNGHEPVRNRSGGAATDSLGTVQERVRILDRPNRSLPRARRESNKTIEFESFGVGSD